MTQGFPPYMQLASEPGRWKVVLTTGEAVHLLAHGYSVEDNEYVFSLLIEGQPPFEVDAVRIPRSVVASVEGG